MSRFALLVVTVLAGCAFDGPGAAGSDDDDPASCAIGSDFDGDGVVDACDDCPHRSGAQQDSDGDGVGDACDPNPQLATEERVLFETFDGTLDGWETVGSWTVAGGVLQHTTSEAVLDFVSPPVTLPRAYVATRVRVEELRRGGDELPSLGVSSGGIAPKTQYYSCAAGWFGVLGDRLYAASQWGAGEFLESADWDDGFGTIDLVQWVSTERSHCYGNNGARERGISTPRGVTEGRVSLYAIDARGTFEYLFIVAIR